MKLQIDTTNQTIKLDERVQLSELMDTLERLLPGKWREFTLETNVTIDWTYPVVPMTPQPWPAYPWITYTITTGVYNVEA